MRLPSKRVTAGLLGAAVIAGGGIAYAATKSSNPRDEYLNDVAKRLNVSPDKLSDALEGASLDQLDRAVKDGRLTQEQADRIKQRIQAGGGVGPLVVPGAGFPGPRGFGGPGLVFKAIGGVLDDVAKELGVSSADLRKELASGKSLSDVAKAHGKAADDVKATITASAKTHLDDAVKNGDLTQKQADRITQELADHLDDLVNASPPPIAGRAFKRDLPFAHGGPRLRGRAFGFGFGAFGADIKAVADYLGVAQDKLRDAIASGKSLADVAKDQGKDVDGLENVIADRLQRKLDAAVKNGDLTQKQADDVAAKLKDHIDEIVQLGLPRWKHP